MFVMRILGGNADGYRVVDAKRSPCGSRLVIQEVRKRNMGEIQIPTGERGTRRKSGIQWAGIREGFLYLPLAEICFGCRPVPMIYGACYV